MVAKLKTSFLKSSFQLFCHKANLAPHDFSPTLESNDTNKDQGAAKIKSNGLQFGSSPNLTLTQIPNDAPSETNTTPNQHSKQVPSRSASASGRVVEDEKSDSSQVKKSDDVNSKPAKKMPKILAKSKLNNQGTSTSNGVVVKKQRSKSSNCLVNREDINYETVNSYTNGVCNGLTMTDDIDVEAKFFRHSFPNTNTDTLDNTICSQKIYDESLNYGHRQHSFNDVTYQQNKPNEEVSFIQKNIK